MLNNTSELAKKHATFDSKFFEKAGISKNLKGSDVTLGGTSSNIQEYQISIGKKMER